MPVRTARLAVGTTGAAGVTQTLVTCPAGVTMIVKDIRVANIVQVGVSTILAIHSGPTFANLFVGTVAVSAVLVLTNAFVVLEPGDALVLNPSAAAALTFYVSGAQLEGVAP